MNSRVSSRGPYEALHRRAGSKPTTLLPDCIDDYVDEDNPVRAADAFVEKLDLAALDFALEPETTGQPGYHPATLLRLYVYGYVNQVQSTRRLERECGRHLELFWHVAEDEHPDHQLRIDRRPAGVGIVRRQFSAHPREI